MTWIYIMIFIVSAIVSAFAAVQLSKHADTISKQTKLGGVLIGTIFLAVATSLPELTATIPASLIGSADIAVGNGLGSVLFNIFFLFLLDLHFRNKRLFLRVSHTHIYTGVVALLLCTVTGIGLAANLSISALNIGLISFIIAFIYIGGMWFLSKTEKPEATEEADTLLTTDSTVRQTVKKFILFAFVIFVFGSALSLTGDAIAKNTGMSTSTVGSILVALATSIPDAMGVYTALRLSNVNLAIGTILGSNVFNILVIAIGDVFYLKGDIWQDTSSDLMYMSIVGFILTALVMLITKRDRTRNTFTYSLPSAVAVVTYLIVVGYIII
ncbi:sodium:calcium antiporter [Thalassobacillus hwangdonensis]|uniref:Sodium:calcium antiporter n=1 Tax=Thalassobacillus hwangdonensis TaxID=546108 RepID=A0ABW3L5I8_9BACI